MGGLSNGGRQAMSQERIHCGGQQGRASVTCSPDSCGMQSLIENNGVFKGDRIKQWGQSARGEIQPMS